MYSTILTKTKEKFFLREVISKKLFKNKSIGKELSSIIISDVLGIDYETIYNNISISSEEIAFSALTVNSTADVVLNDKKDKMIIDIEINGYNGKHKENQTISYVCQLFLSQLRTHKDYLNVNKVLQINIDTDDFLGYNEFIYEIYLMDTKHHQIANDNIQIYHLNLDYLRKLDYNIIKENELMKTLYFFICGEDELSKVRRNGDEFMKKVAEEVMKIAGKEKVIPYMSEEEMREFDKAYYSDLAREEGREERTNEMIISLYHNGVSLDIISKSSGLSIEEIEKIIKEQDLLN